LTRLSIVGTGAKSSEPGCYGSTTAVPKDWCIVTSGAVSFQIPKDEGELYANINDFSDLIN
jgi:hypothetical protein